MYSYKILTQCTVNLTEPNINMKSILKNENYKNQKLTNTVHKPRMAYSWDKVVFKNILIKKIRDKLRREI